MPSNDPIYQREYKKKHYQANKQKYIQQAKKRRQKLTEEIRELKKNPCVDCGNIFNPWQMHFDHRPDEIKISDISTLIQRSSKSKILEEIEKCDLVCANCHADRTYYRQL